MLANPAWTEWEGVAVSYPRYYYPPGIWRASYGGFFKAAINRTFRKAVAEFKPDVVYGCFAYPDGWAACKLAREYGLPVGVKVHGSDLLLLNEHPGRKPPTIEMLREVDAISAVSDDLRQCAVSQGTPEQRAHLIYEGTDRELFCPGDRQAARRALGLNHDGIRLLFVGNLVPVKAIDILIDCCAQLKAGGLRFEVDLVGEGHVRGQLQQQITRLGMADQIHFRGCKPKNEIPHWYRAADLVVLSSHSEGVPNVLVEAAACGIPFVATNVGGIPEIAHLSPRALVPPNNPDALARTLEDVLRNPAGTTTSVKSSEVSSIADCADATLNLFSEILADRKSRAETNRTPSLVASGDA
ncbi:MAG TPA: glycosyltransferase [Planctomycetaceae bacterium]